MARPSRRNNQNKKDLPQTPVTVVPKIAAGAYIRFSVETEDEGTTETQLELIRSFVTKQEGLELKDIYIDNGYTGTNFDRPELPEKTLRLSERSLKSHWRIEGQ